MKFFDRMFKPKEEIVGAPVAGKVVPVSEVNDPTFSEGIVGQGVAILPTGNAVVAPCDAVVDVMFETGHAVSITTAFGAEVLIHVGLETVKLGGQHFTVHVKKGDRVKAGQLMIEFDREAIAAEGYDTITPVVICNAEEFGKLTTTTGRVAAVGDRIIGLQKK